MPGVTKLGEEYTVYIATNHTTGGVWASATWVELTCATDVSDNPGLIVAEFNFRGVPNIGGRRSLRRKPELSITCGLFHGDAAFDRLYAASVDQLNAGAEILRMRIVEGKNNVVGNKFVENDFIVASITKVTPSGEAFEIEFGFMRAADSPNTPILNGTTTGT
jgi:hypothetical protein